MEGKPKNTLVFSFYTNNILIITIYDADLSFAMFHCI